jgi:hypothetical protein
MERISESKEALVISLRLPPSAVDFWQKTLKEVTNKVGHSDDKRSRDV